MHHKFAKFSSINIAEKEIVDTFNECAYNHEKREKIEKISSIIDWRLIFCFRKRPPSNEILNWLITKAIFYDNVTFALASGVQ